MSRAGVLALLALFATACQPAGTAPSAGGEKAAAAAASEAIADASAPADLARFKAGEFAKLSFDGGTTLPASPMLDADGGQHFLSEYAGKVVVLNIWGEWCPPCVEEMPTLAGLQDAFPDGEVAVVPVAFGDPEARASAAAKLKELAGERLPFFYDPDFNISADAGTGAFPSTVIYDRKGREAARLIYPADWASGQAQELVRAVLARAD